MSTMNVKKVPGADGNEVGIGRKLPAGDRCLAWFEFGGSERLSIRDHSLAGSRGHLAGTPSFGAAGFSGTAQLLTDVPNNLLTGDFTMVVFFKPGASGADLSTAFAAGGGLVATDQFFESSPTRYSAAITQRVFTSAPRDVVGQCGTYDSTTPAANGTNNGIQKLITTSLTETLCVVQKYVASTRVHSLTLRNGATFATPSTSTATAAANHIRDTRTTLPFEVGTKASSGSVAYSFMVYGALTTQAEDDAIYALERTRLTALGVPNL